MQTDSREKLVVLPGQGGQMLDWIISVKNIKIPETLVLAVH